MSNGDRNVGFYGERVVGNGRLKTEEKGKEEREFYGEDKTVSVCVCVCSFAFGIKKQGTPKLHFHSFKVYLYFDLVYFSK